MALRLQHNQVHQRPQALPGDVGNSRAKMNWKIRYIADIAEHFEAARSGTGSASTDTASSFVVDTDTRDIKGASSQYLYHLVSRLPEAETEALTRYLQVRVSSLN